MQDEQIMKILFASLYALWVGVLSVIAVAVRHVDPGPIALCVYIFLVVSLLVFFVVVYYAVNKRNAKGS